MPKFKVTIGYEYRTFYTMAIEIDAVNEATAKKAVNALEKKRFVDWSTAKESGEGEYGPTVVTAIERIYDRRTRSLR